MFWCARNFDLKIEILLEGWSSKTGPNSPTIFELIKTCGNKISYLHVSASPYPYLSLNHILCIFSKGNNLFHFNN